MDIELHGIKVKDIYDGYTDSSENGVVGYGGKLNIRPAFQREFVYKEKQQILEYPLMVYICRGNEKHLNIRAFTDNEKRKVYERQEGICPNCKAEGRERIHYDISEMEADHVTPWCEGGKTNTDNCQMLCKEHNRKKSNK